MDMKPVHGLKQERELRGWSQARVAELLETDSGNVSRWERGISSPSPYYRERLCRLYEKNMQELGLLSEKQRESGEREVEGVSTEQHEARQAGERLLQEEDTQQYSQSKSTPAFASKMLACLSYSLGWVTGLIVLLFNRSNRFVLFHSLQSICFFGMAQIIFLLGVVTAASGEHLLFFVMIRNIGGPLTVLLSLVAWVVGMIQAARGNYYLLPFVGKLCERLALRLTRAQQEEPLEKSSQEAR